LAEMETETGLKYPELLLRIDMAERSFKYGDMDSFNGIMDDFHSESERLSKVFRTEGFNQELSGINDDILHLMAMDIDMSGTDELMSYARSALGDQDLDRTREAITSLNEFLTETKATKAKELATELIRSTKTLFEPLKTRELPADEIRAAFKEAVTAIKGGNYFEGCQLTLKTRDMIETIQRDSANELLDGIQKYVEENEEMGADALRSEAFLFKARYLSGKNAFTKAFELAEQADKTAKLARKNFYSANVTLFINEVQHLMKDAVGFGIDISEIEEMVVAAETHFKNNELEQGNTIAFEARKNIRESINEKLDEILSIELASLQGTMEEAKKIEALIEEESEAMHVIEELKNEEKYQEAREKVNEILLSVNVKISDRNREIYLPKIETAKNELDALSEETGKEHPALSAFIESSRTALESEDFEALDSALAEFDRGKEEAYNQYREEKYHEEITQLETIISEMTALGLDIPDEVLNNLENLKNRED